MTTLANDLSHAVRMFRQAPGFVLVVVLTLALGIGANAVLFSVVNGVLLNPLAYPGSNELVVISEKRPGMDQSPPEYLNFLDWQQDARSFASMAIYRNQDYNLTRMSRAQRVSGYMISADFFRTLGVPPVIGRYFRADDDRLGAAAVVILGGGFWNRQFGSSPDVLGRTLVLNGRSYLIIGVVPASFTFYGHDRDVYTPIGQWDDPSFRDRRISVSAHVIGRLKGGVSLGQAKADMERVAGRLAEEYPVADKGAGIGAMPLKEDIVGGVRPLLFVLLAAVGFLLLIACANIANLLLARSMGRSREFAIRAALGAGQGRIVRQLVTENILLAGVGGVTGLLFVFGAMRTMVHALPGTLPRAEEISVDGRVLLFAAALTLVSVLIFGLAPALRASRVDVQEILKEGGRGASGPRQRLQRVFVSAEVAMALVLLAGAGLMLRSFAALWRVNQGFNPSHALTFNLSIPSSATTTPAETRARLRQFDDKMRTIPGVQAVSITLGSRPMIHDSAVPFCHVKQWGPGADAKAALEAEFFYPFMQMPEKLMRMAAGGAAVVLRAEGDPTSVMNRVRQAVEEIDSREVIYAVRTMDDVVAESLAARRISMVLLSIFATLALAIASIGIYGVISYVVSQRTREIGLRTALGAQASDVLSMVLWEGARMTLAGLGVGLAAALGLTRFMASQLFSVSAQDPLTFLGVGALLMAVALLACYVPARRAVRVDPVVALRGE